MIPTVSEALWKEFYRNTFVSLDQVKRTLTMNDRVVLVAVDKYMRFLGTASLTPSYDSIIASDVVVLEEERSKGVARMLANEAIKRSRVAGFKEIRATFDPNISLWQKQFYASIGFLESTANVHVLFIQ